MSATRTPWLRIAGVSLPPVLLALWLTLPAFRPQPVQAEGRLQRAEACLGWCADVIAVGELRLACRVDFLGLPYDCAERLLQPGAVSVSYAPMPSLAGLLGRAPTAGVVTRLERDGELVFRRSITSQVWAALYGGWVFNALYWPIAGLVIWRWPRSRFARRVTWAD